MVYTPKKGITLANGMRYSHGQIIGPSLPTRSMSGKRVHVQKYRHPKKQPINSKCKG